ncbi:MAG: hypothetical protein GF330_02335, partial [Candidatus Eisenbacteria bacterium]|nr:hypothetical protein [Candidatus Eisenbacteria bacterium]
MSATGSEQPHPEASDAMDIDTGARRHRLALWLVLALALLLRLVFVLTLGDAPLWHDAREYDALARELLASGQYRLDDGTPTAFWPPGYPGFLATIYGLVFAQPLAARLLQGVLGALTCWLLYGIARQLADRRVALLSALGLAIYPLLIYATGTLYPVILVTFLWAALLRLLLAARRESHGRFLLAGALGGGLVLTTPSAGPALLGVALWCLWYFGQLGAAHPLR